jgi:hypothetical protein
LADLLNLSHPVSTEQLSSPGSIIPSLSVQKPA